MATNARNTQSSYYREAATTEAEGLLIDIADRQRQIAKILNEAAAKVEALATANAEAERRVEDLITRRNANVKPIAGTIRRQEIRTGDLNSTLVDAIERRGQQVFPPAKQIACPWAIVPNNY